jgi:hypothetical protein
LIQSEEELENALTEPRPVLVEFMRSVSNPLVVLGAGGKMGPTLAVLARRAADAASHAIDVIAVSRFSDERARLWLEERGVQTLSADLLERGDVSKLPDATNLIYLVGLKFGTAQNPSLTWAVNTVAPAHTAERYRSARIVALSTGNVYPLVPVTSGGATEGAPLTPLGEYANAAVARERVFEYFSQKQGTPLALIRLNYAVELRYGLLVDIARKVWAEEPIDVTTGAFNCIWQADANEMILRSLALAASPAQPWNLTGTQPLPVREMASRFGQLLGKRVSFSGTEAGTALLSDPSKLVAALGPPATSLDTMTAWIAHWIKAGGRLLDKPTHFEVRDGTY